MEIIKCKSLAEALALIQKNGLEFTNQEKDLENSYSLTVSWKAFVSGKEARAKLKLYKTETEKRISNLKITIEESKQYLSDMCMFDFDIIMQFLASAITLMEEEEYRKVDKKLIIPYYAVGLAAILDMMTYDEEKSFKKFSLVASMDNLQMVTEEFDEKKLKETISLRKTLQGQKYLLMKAKETYSVFDSANLKIPKELTEYFPYLPAIIDDLISYRIANPDLDMRNITEYILEKVKIDRALYMDDSYSMEEKIYQHLKS